MPSHLYDHCGPIKSILFLGPVFEIANFIQGASTFTYILHSQVIFRDLIKVSDLSF